MQLTETQELEIKLAATEQTLAKLKTVVAERIAAKLNHEWQRDVARLNWMADSYGAVGMTMAEAEKEAQAYEEAYNEAKRRGMTDRLAVRVAVDVALALQQNK